MNEIFHYGEMNLTVDQESKGGRVSKFELAIGGSTLDLCSLPVAHPAKMRKGISLSVIVSLEAYGAHYAPGKHSLNFNHREFQGRTFPLTFFEELHHAETYASVNKQLELERLGCYLI